MGIPVRNYLIERDDNMALYRGKGPVQIGRIIEVRSGKMVAEIVYDKNDYVDNLYQCRCVIGEYPDGIDRLMIIVSDRYKSYMFEKPKFFEAMAMHELGHYMAGHLEESFFENLHPEALNEEQKKEAIVRDRINNIKSGRVDPVELEADAFACRELGKSIVALSLDFLSRERAARGDDAAELAIKEFQLRKKAVRGR